MSNRVHSDVKSIVSYVVLTVLWFSFAHGYGAGFLLDSVTFFLGFALWVLASWRYFKLNPLGVWTG